MGSSLNNRPSDLTLLFPSNLLREESVLGRLISDIDEDSWTDQVQIIGWLYQYYNTELKDDTFAKLKKNIKITKERIPAANITIKAQWDFTEPNRVCLGCVLEEGFE